MANKLSIRAKEGSTFIVRAEFFAKTSDGTPPSPVVPNAGLSWSLRDVSGNIINLRNEVSLTPDEVVVIVLMGDDLALATDYPEKRYLTIQGTYDSLLGDNLPLLDEVEFQIENLVGALPS